VARALENEDSGVPHLSDPEYPDIDQARIKNKTGCSHRSKDQANRRNKGKIDD